MAGYWANKRESKSELPQAEKMECAKERKKVAEKAKNLVDLTENCSG